MRSRHISVVIHRRPDEVYDLAGDPTRLPEWADGLATGAASVDDELHIGVDSDDAGARRFYERHGFSDTDPDTGSGMRLPLRQL